MSTANPSGKPIQAEVNQGEPLRQSSTHSAKKAAGPRNPEKDPKELGKLRRIEQAGIKIMPAVQRYGSRLALPHCGTWRAHAFGICHAVWFFLGFAATSREK